jgi:hypothetical protein
MTALPGEGHCAVAMNAPYLIQNLDVADAPRKDTPNTCRPLMR